MNRKNSKAESRKKSSTKIKILKVSTRKAGKAINSVTTNVAVAGGLLGVPVYEFLYW